MLSALKRVLLAKKMRELGGGLLDVLGMLVLLGYTRKLLGWPRVFLISLKAQSIKEKQGERTAGIP